MAALTADAPLEFMVGPEASYPVLTNSRIYQGSLVGLTSAGYARAFVLGDKFVGHARQATDNRTTDTFTGASGDLYVPTFRGTYFAEVSLSGVAITDTGKPVYAQDSGTLSLESGDRVGVVSRYTASGKAVVQFEPHGSGEGMPILEIRETIAIGDFTDNTDATGYVDLATQIPGPALVLGFSGEVDTGFTGDTTAVISVGIAGDLDKFSANTAQSVLAAGKVGSAAIANAAFIASATTVRVTVTGGSDFGNIAAGAADIGLLYIPLA